MTPNNASSQRKPAAVPCRGRQLDLFGRDAHGQFRATVAVDLLHAAASRASLRLRPDHIIIGEVIGAEALESVRSLNTGHKAGTLTIHRAAKR
jgi:type IV secretory pathway ATPase VirB11/archaellum biosynthesis ATPase